MNMKLKKVLMIFTIIVSSLFTSCDDNKVIYDPATGQSLAFFSETSVSLPVFVGSSETIEVIVGISTISSSDRTLTVSLNEKDTKANSDQFTFDSTVTIPANEYFGTISITGIDEMLDTSPTKIVLMLEDPSDGVFDGNELNISIFKTCPIDPATFVGDYLIEQTSSYVDGPTLDDGSVVSLELVDGDQSARVFYTANYTWYCSTPNAFTFNLVCDQVLVPNNQSNCSCDGNLWFTAPDVPGSFDINDDSVFYLTFTDDANTDCGAPVQTTYKFTKQ